MTDITSEYSRVNLSSDPVYRYLRITKGGPGGVPGDCAEQDILDIANYQVASTEMIATPLHKDFLKRADPHERVVYKEVPELVYS